MRARTWSTSSVEREAWRVMRSSSVSSPKTLRAIGCSMASVATESGTASMCTTTAESIFKRHFGGCQ